MGRRNTNALLKALTADAEGIQRLAPVIKIVLAALFDLIAHAVGDKTLLFQQGNSRPNSLPLGLGMVDIPHVFLGILLHFLFFFLGHHFVCRLFFEEQLLFQGLCFFHDRFLSFFSFGFEHL